MLIQITLSDGGDLDESDGAKSILMSYIQLIFLLKTFPIAWPDLFITIFRIGGAITALGQHLVNLKCLSKGMSEADVFFHLKIMSAAGPPVLLLLCVVTWYLVAALFRRIKCCSADHPYRCCRVPFCFDLTVTNLTMKIKSSCVALLYLLWPNICSETFSLFACRSVCDDDVMYLRADLNEVCWQAGSRHLDYVLCLGIPMMLLYVIGLPVSTWYRVWRLQLAARSRAAAQMTPELRASKRRRGSSIHYVESDMNDDHKIYGMFFSAFHENTWWWESTIAGRKIIIAMIGVFGATMGSMQVHLTLMLVVVILLITAQVRPFGGVESVLLQGLEMASLVSIFLTLWAAAVFYLYPKCQDPLKPEGMTLAWCDTLSVTVGILDIVMVLVLIGCYAWLKVRGGSDEEEQASATNGGVLTSAISESASGSASDQVGIEMPERVMTQPIDRAFNFDKDDMESNPMPQREEEEEEEEEESGGAGRRGITMNSGVEEKVVEISQDTSTGGAKLIKQRRLSSRELMREQGLHPVKGDEMTTVSIGEGDAAAPIAMQKKSHWSKLQTSVKATSVFKAGRKKRVKRLSQVVKARRNSATSAPKDEIALPPCWERVYDDAEEDYYYYNSETEETRWERPEE